MLKVLPVIEKDFDRAYPLLQQIPTAVLVNKETWRRLFVKQWDCQIEPLGFVLTDGDETVGYIGLISAKREVNGEPETIMGLTSWTVKKEHGGHAMKLIFPFIRDQEKTFTCFTPAKSVDAVLRRFGFQELNSSWQLIPLWMTDLGKTQHQVIFEVDQQLSLLSQRDLQIYNDHQKSSAEHLIIKDKEKACYILAKRTLRKKLPFLQVHYVSDKKFFADVIGTFTLTICYRTKTLGLIVFDSYLEHQKIKGSIRIEMPDKPLFRSPKLKSHDIDSLYSEFFVLDF